jgi:hypothetical protein
MSSQPTSSERRPASTGRPYLRLLRGSHGQISARQTRASVGATTELGGTTDVGSATEVEQGCEQARPHPERSRILVAGADPERRATVLRDLSEALPAETQFGEAGAAWEVLEQAPSSGVVMLAGDLDEVTAESLMNVLGHRYPSLPVVALGLLAGSSSASGAPGAHAAQR